MFRTTSEGRKMKKMTVQDAKDIYIDYGYQVFEDEMETLFSPASTGHEYHISNSNYLHALFLTDVLFSSTFRDIKMVTGNGGDGFIETLLPSFKKALRRIDSRLGEVKVLVFPQNGQNNWPVLEKLQRQHECLKIRQGKPSNATPHYIITDSLKVRLEQPHPLIREDSDADIIRATVHLNNIKAAKDATSRFNASWDNAIG